MFWVYGLLRKISYYAITRVPNLRGLNRAVGFERGLQGLSDTLYSLGHSSLISKLEWNVGDVECFALKCCPPLSKEDIRAIGSANYKVAEIDEEWWNMVTNNENEVWGSLD